MTERRGREISTVGTDDFRMAVLRGSLGAVKDFINKGLLIMETFCENEGLSFVIQNN